MALTYNGRPRPPQVLLERRRHARRSGRRRGAGYASGVDRVTSLPRDRFAARLAAVPLLADGGMGTLLFSRGIPQRACLDELATSRPDLVGAIHREYLDAGADLIETLTFGANRLRLDAYGLAAEAGRFNRRAAQVAREARDVVAAATRGSAGSIGPLGPPTRELRHPDEAAIRAAFREQVDGLLEGGVDLLVIETFFDLAHLLLAVDEARAGGRRAGHRVDDVRRGPRARGRDDARAGASRR